MLVNVFTDQIAENVAIAGAKDSSFLVEVHNNYVTVDRRHQHTSLVESKTIKVDKDVLVQLHRERNNQYTLECKWLWRDPTVFENLLYDEAKLLKQVITQIATSLQRLAVASPRLNGIEVGNQMWASEDINLDMGLESKISRASGYSKYGIKRLYTFTGAKKIEENYPDWRIPTVEDYLELFEFLPQAPLKELVKNLKFGFYGFHSNRLSTEEMIRFQKMNPALKPFYGGFYWTSDIEGYDPKNEKYGKRKYIYLNRLSKQVTIEESVNLNDNFFSLRLIHR